MSALTQQEPPSCACGDPLTTEREERRDECATCEEERSLEIRGDVEREER